MKKLFLLTVFTIGVIITSCHSQEADPRNKLYFGLKGGFNYSNVYDSHGETFEADPKFGFASGLFLSLPIGRLIGIQPEIQFSQRGFHGTGALLGSSYKLTRTTNYIDVPVLFSLKPTKVVTILAGPQYSYTLKQKDVFTNSTLSIQQEEAFKNDNIRKNTLCFLGGFDLNIHPVVFGFRVGWDLQMNNGDGTFTTIQYKNVWTQGAIGFRF